MYEMCQIFFTLEVLFLSILQNYFLIAPYFTERNKYVYFFNVFFFCKKITFVGPRVALCPWFFSFISRCWGVRFGGHRIGFLLLMMWFCWLHQFMISSFPQSGSQPSVKQQESPQKSRKMGRVPSLGQRRGSTQSFGVVVPWVFFLAW